MTKNDSIVVQENKPKKDGYNVKIKCWRCKKPPIWVRVGSLCHKHGVCGDCIMEMKYDNDI